MTKKQLIGYTLLVLAVVILVIVVYNTTPVTKSPLIFSNKDMMTTLWDNYKENYLEAGTLRTLDKQQDNITTSEGESYTMLRSVWMDDKATFDATYAWLNNNLKRKKDNLNSWLFGKTPAGTYGILVDKGGYNSATDADTDIAVALIFAANRWQQPSYLDDAKKLASDIWTHDVVTINGIPYMTADDLEKTSSQKPIINVSYLSPYAYRMFAKIDPAHDWNALITSSYDVLNKASQAKLSSSTSVGIPPDWVVINRTTGAIEASTNNGQDSNFSYDALRTPWRIALDYTWYKDPRDKQYLDSLSFFSTQWKNNKSLASVYGHDGSIITSSEAPAIYGGLIGYFKVSDPSNAKDVYAQKIQFLYNPDTNAWKKSLGYYDENWAWFGIGLYNDLLPNLSVYDK